MTREEAVEVITDYLNKDTAISPYNIKFLNALYTAIEALQAQPVVRCKECKYWNSKTDLTHCYRLAWVGTEKDDYCSFSERREP